MPEAWVSGPDAMGPTDPAEDVRTGRLLQYATIAWNVAEAGVTVGLGFAAGSLALVAFGLDSMIEVFASVVVLWHMSDRSDSTHDRVAVRLVSAAFSLLAISLLLSAGRALWAGSLPHSSWPGMFFLGVTSPVMFVLAAWKKRIGLRLDSQPFLAEARVTFLDGCLATAILVALAVNAALGWWWADPLVAIAVGIGAAREARALSADSRR
ncbi:MAG: divalent metal cation (Fe/Co/Zn/Cd) transporter [Myxococcota bacterium]